MRAEGWTDGKTRRSKGFVESKLCRSGGFTRKKGGGNYAVFTWPGKDFFFIYDVITWEK